MRTSAVRRSPRSRRRLGRRIALAVAALAGTALTGAPAVLALGHHATAALATAAVPLLATPATRPAGVPVDGIGASPDEHVLLHVHAHLQIYVDGRQRAVPAGIGIAPPYRTQPTPEGPFIDGGAAFWWLHTHDTTGVIHVESPVRRAFTLGEFFDVWGQPLGPDRVGPARGRLTAVVDGVRFAGDPRRIPLAPHHLIQLSVGQPVPFRPYAFAPGL